MASFIFSHRLGTLSVIYGVYLEVIIVFTYVTMFNIPFLSELPCPEVTFPPRRNRDPERRCRINSVIIEDSDIVRPS
jgi:hypothetical protein